MAESDENCKEIEKLSFNTEADVKAFAKWFLRTTVSEIEDEFSSPEERIQYLNKRELRLNYHLSDLTSLSFGKANRDKLKDAKFFKIVKECHHNALSADGAEVASSRFNYKNIPFFKNRTIYFGQDKDCCTNELFHLEIQKKNLMSLGLSDKKEFEESIIKIPKYKVYEYKISMENILILTSEPSFKAIGITNSVVKNEWYNENVEYMIPTAGQLLATKAKKYGFNGILYTSVRSQTKSNLVLFEENTGKLNFEQDKCYDLNVK